MTSKQILSSKAIVTLLIIVLAFLANSKFQQWRQARAINKLKNDLLAQASVQQQKNQELSDSLSLLDSGNFKEQVARQQLGLKKNGETVYNFTQGDISTSTAGSGDPQALSNPQKWWNYFYK
jgi:cell division protein FtsB